jgi:diguanylate cyclase (GGDEF)-like protein
MRIMGKKNRRLTIGFQSLSVYGYYYKNLLRGIYDEVNEQDVNLILFPGRCYPSSYQYEHQYTLVYNFMNAANIDGLIVTPGSMIDLIGMEKTLQFYKKYASIPMVSLNIRIPGVPVLEIDNMKGLRNLIRHLLDDHGFRRCAFIRGPKENEEARIRFSVYREMLEERSLPFEERLVVDGDFTDTSGKEAIEELIDTRKVDADVLIAANDAMAIGAIEALSIRGIRVPHDIAVTGFDNLLEGASCIPSLTTVAQPLYGQARQAIKTIIALVRGDRVPDTISFDTEPVIRSSCGCRSGEEIAKIEKPFSSPFVRDDSEDAIEKFISPFVIGRDAKEIAKECYAIYKRHCKGDKWETIGFINDLKRLLSETALSDHGFDTIRGFISFLNAVIGSLHVEGGNVYEKMKMVSVVESMFRDSKETGCLNSIMVINKNLSNLRYLIRDCSTTFNLSEILSRISPSIYSIGIESCFIMLFQTQITYTNGMEPPPPDTIRLIFSDPDNIGIDTENIVFSYPTMLPEEYLPESRNSVYVITPLYFMEQQYGYMLMDYSPETLDIHEILATQISTTYKRSLMIDEITESERKLRSALSELSTYTRHLQQISERDELTGLYNRRGFVSLATAALDVANQQGICSILFFFDLDDLKEINDTHGHNEGDFALKAAASILENSFRNSDIIGRIGGDEFIAFSSNVAPEHVGTLVDRITLKTEHLNIEISKPFTIHMTCGWAVSNASRKRSYKQLLKEADEMLYKNKNQKKYDH